MQLFRNLIQFIGKKWQTLIRSCWQRKGSPNPGQTKAKHSRQRQGVPIQLIRSTRDHELLRLYKAMDLAG